jgi:hypothetical protein
MNDARARRLLCLAVALALLSLAIVPQAYLWLARGRAWQGSFSYFTTDERAYAAYVNALADGRPRRSDPYTGRDERADSPQPESLFSIQFLPAYALATVARVLRLRTDACFFALLCAVAIAASLVLFRLIHSLTGDARLAAAGTIFVLCLGALAAGDGIWNAHSLAAMRFRQMLFLRRYQPAFAFPLFFAFCLLVRRALARGQRSLFFAALAGLVFAALVFTYFFYWTAAAAWLACIIILWLLARRDEWRNTLRLVGVVSIFAVAALVPYFALLARRASTMETTQALVRTHAPDLFRVPELIGFVVIVSLVWSWRRGAITGANSCALFAASFALLPVPLFNQQIITGRSLQPFHYDIFIANYCVLLSIVLAAPLVLRHKIPTRALATLALAAYCWGFFEVAVWVHRSKVYLLLQDDLRPVAARLRELGGTNDKPDTESNIYAPTPSVADLLPTAAPQPVLWAPHMIVFSGAAGTEERERLLQYFYYQGADLSATSGRDFETLDRKSKYYLSLLLSSARINANMSAAWRPVTTEETDRALASYKDYSAAFSRERAASPKISYVLVYDFDRVDLSNFDRFYERDTGERVGRFTLYRVKGK